VSAAAYLIATTAIAAAAATNTATPSAMRTRRARLAAFHRSTARSSQPGSGSISSRIPMRAISRS